MSDHFANVARFLEERAYDAPHQCAIRIPEKRKGKGKIPYQDYSFFELNQSSNAMVALLTNQKIQRNTRVLLMAKPGADLILITFALFKIGAIPILIDPGMGLKNFLNCVKRSQPEALIGIPLAHSISRLFFPIFKSIRTRIVIGTQSFQKAINAIKPTLSHLKKPHIETRAKDLAAILFTSGSTGLPKGVCYEHRHFEAQIQLIQNHYKIQPGEIDLPMLPIFALFNPALGVTTIVPEMNPSRPAMVDPTKIVQAIQENQVTHSFGSPVLWAKIYDYCRKHDIQLMSMRRILMAGAPVSPQLIDRFQSIIPHGTIHTPYGATECLPATSLSSEIILHKTAQKTLLGRGTCVGKPLPGIAIKIIPIVQSAIDSIESTASLLPNTVGEIIVQGPIVTEMYDGLPEATKLAKIKDKKGIWHRMGDLGYLDTEGQLWFCGRKAEYVQTESGPLYTDCCENIFNQHPRVYRSALIGIHAPINHEAKIYAAPAIVIEPLQGHWPQNEAAQQQFTAELKAIAKIHAETTHIQTFLFCKKFPVDVRHNAKIHRLKLAQVWNKRIPGKST